MRIKTFQGRSLEEVLPQIREELGVNAVVIGQRTKVEGGVAGFFGTKVIEVTAADQMPEDEQLVDLEDRLMSGEEGAAAQEVSLDEEAAALAQRFAGAMQMGRRGGLDVTDEWDPAQDAELAQEYGRVLEHAAAAGGFSELDVPVMPSAAAAAPAAPAAPPTTQPPASDPLAQAQALAARTHQHVHQATTHMDDAVYAPQISQTYAPPRPLPHTTPVEERARTFAASVLDTPMQGYDPAAVPTPGSAASSVDAALRSDLGLPFLESDASQAVDNAIDMIDLRTMAALRNAVHASRRLDEPIITAPEPPRHPELAEIGATLAAAGVDDDVIEALADTALRHRRPFGGEQDFRELMRQLIEETLDVRTGFPHLGRAYRMGFVGNSGSGKTSVVAKVAETYRSSGMQVGILSLLGSDPHAGDSRLGALQIDVRYAATPEQAAHGVEGFAAYDLVLVDTPGSACMDDASFDLVRSCLAAIGIDDVHVVVPLATSSREARARVDAFRPLGANRLVVSRLDESRYIGQLLNFGFRLGVPMTFLSEGPRVPDDLRAASAREIADRILPRRSS